MINTVNVLNYFKLISSINGGNNIKIAEIGAGIGGEYCLFSKLKDLLPVNFKSCVYEVYDLPSSKKIIQKFCTSLDIALPVFKDIYSDVNGLEEYDLVISNGAFSEMRGKLINDYYNKVVERSKCGYFLSNFHTHSSVHADGWSAEDFMRKLKDSGKNPILIKNLKGIVSPFDNGANVLILFGFDSPKNILHNMYHSNFKDFAIRFLNKMRSFLS